MDDPIYVIIIFFYAYTMSIKYYCSIYIMAYITVRCDDQICPKADSILRLLTNLRQETGERVVVKSMLEGPTTVLKVFITLINPYNANQALFQ